MPKFLFKELGGKTMSNPIIYNSRASHTVVHSKRTGELTEPLKMGFFSTGELQWTIPYKDGKMHGTFRGYYRTGEIQFELSFLKGEFFGALIIYDQKGFIISESIYSYEERRAIDCAMKLVDSYVNPFIILHD
jgi:antitoxin component YwqK of YwqJK toxin-antitoxin module